MKTKGILIAGLALQFAVFGCGAEDSSDTGNALTQGTPVDFQEFNTSVDQQLSKSVSGGSECLTSPLAGTCFDQIHSACFDPSGGCFEQAAGPTSTWTWDNGANFTFEIAGFDETGANYLMKITGVNSAGEECVTGVMEYRGLEGRRIMTLDVDGSVLQRVDVYDAVSLPYTIYTCSDGQSFEVPLEETVLADACFFGPNAKPCGFLKPVADEVFPDQSPGDMQPETGSADENQEEQAESAEE